MFEDLSEIRISVALVTRNRPECLDRCLESLRAQNIQPFEVVVSDDSDLDRAQETETIAKRWDCRYISGPRRGLYANRNYAALACKGTHVRTMDDDHVFPEEHMKQCLNAVSSDPLSIWTTGEISFVDGNYYVKANNAGQLHPSGVGGPVADVNDNWAIADGSTIYPKDIFDKGYRMIEDYKYGSSYLEFGAYLYHHGFRCRCVPDAFVKHYADKSTINRNDSNFIESIFYSSLCFNLYFKTNYMLATKYIISYIWRLRFNRNVILFLPKILFKVERRWKRQIEYI